MIKNNLNQSMQTSSFQIKSKRGAVHFEYGMGFLGGWDYNYSDQSQHEIAWSSNFDPKPYPPNPKH